MSLNRDATARWVNGYTLLLATLVVYLPLFWQVPLIRSEAMYALIPKEMLASGSWLTPTLNGVPYLDKPHLIYWLNLLAYKIFGVSDRVARLPLLSDRGHPLPHLQGDDGAHQLGQLRRGPGPPLRPVHDAFRLRAHRGPADERSGRPLDHVPLEFDLRKLSAVSFRRSAKTELVRPWT